MYRDIEIQPLNHPILGFMDNLNSCNVPSTILHLDGMSDKDPHSMIYNALCTFPRLCKTLSNTVFHKTKSNPYNVVVILKYATGSEERTSIPKLVLGDCNSSGVLAIILYFQPRRVVAVALARHVAEFKEINARNEVS